MSLTELKITTFRNFSFIHRELHPRFNLITGENGSGKTSFLEAVYLLSRGISFKTRERVPLIKTGDTSFTVFGKTSFNETVSIQKSLTHPTRAQLNGIFCTGTSILAKKLPSLLCHETLFDFLEGGSKFRRTLLDWGVFYENTQYHILLKEYREVLKQRNYLLTEKRTWEALLPWSKLLASLGENIHQRRQSYVTKLKKKFEKNCIDFMQKNISFVYEAGWDKKQQGKTLLEVLKASFERDVARQYTHYGAHQADCLFYFEGKSVRDYLSRGQKKMLFFAFRLAQATLLKEPSLFLIDDLASELDNDHLCRLFEFFQTIPGQFFLTARPNDASLFLNQLDGVCEFSLSTQVG